MELLWLFGMSTKAYAWFVLIVSGILAILLTIAANKESNDFMHDYFGIPNPIELPDEITIEIVKENSQSQTSASQTEPSALPESATEHLASGDVSHPMQKTGDVPE